MIQRYLARQRLAGRRPATIRVLAVVLHALEKHLGHPIETADRWELEAFLARELSPASRQVYRSHLRGFYSWLAEEGLREDDPSARLPSVRRPRGVPRPISEPDLRRALEFATARMRAWLLLMSLAGLRCMEVAALRPQDVQVETDGAVLYLPVTKGGGSGMVPAHTAILEALARLPQYDGQWWDVTGDQVSRRVGTYLRGIGIDASAHQLRHFAGTSWYSASGHDLLATARLLRHVNVATTQVYAQLDPARSAEVVGLVKVPA